MTNQPEGKKNFNGGECTCDKFVNCHDCRDMHVSHLVYRDKVLKKQRIENLDLINGRLEGLKILLKTPIKEKTMTNKELRYAITEIEIIRDCIDIEKVMEK